MYEITKELIVAHERLTASLKENLKGLEEAAIIEKELKEIIDTLSSTILTGHIFIQHIQDHLKDGEDVVCKICNKTVDDIYEEDKDKHVKKGRYVFSYQAEEPTDNLKE